MKGVIYILPRAAEVASIVSKKKSLKYTQLLIMSQGYLLYWGKTSPSSDKNAHTQIYHPLPYHCLDVAAVAREILEKDPLLRKWLSLNAKIQDLVPLVCFFLALHDLGKFSVRFQNLAPKLLQRLQGRESSLPYSKNLHHTRLGFLLWNETLAQAFHDGTIFDLSMPASKLRKYLNPWFLAITGHHGRPPVQKSESALTLFEPGDVHAAMAFIQDIAALFVQQEHVEQLLNKEIKEAQTRFSYTLAGFATLCDWIGSDERFFKSEGGLNVSLDSYFQRLHLLGRNRLLRQAAFSDPLFNLKPYFRTSFQR